VLSGTLSNQPTTNSGTIIRLMLLLFIDTVTVPMMHMYSEENNQSTGDQSIKNIDFYGTERQTVAQQGCRTEKANRLENKNVISKKVKNTIE